MKNIAYIGSIVICMCLMAFSNVQSSEIVETKIITKTIGVGGYNRISIEDDRIEEVFVSSGNPKIDVNEKLGQIFVNPRDIDEDIKLSIFSEKSKVYDLHLIAKKERPISFVIREAEPKVKTINKSEYLELIAEVEASKLLNRSLKKRITLENGIVGEYVGEVSRGTKFIEAVELYNPNSISINLSKSFFKSELSADSIIAESSFIGAKELKTIYLVREAI